ncbi:uncharacterized protein LOC143290291 [Babylonia areolata]|uniref:uncharacterized protein LOC143290291 n=1 Tax=Babylonia areolata TaxID=304850 RepID=UPI003FD5B97B
MCRQLPSCEMYEGKNIHYSLVDNKPLCSFSKKQCNQRRLNGYGFCVRHILEDPTAPFRRCSYVAKSSQHLCTQAIPQGEDRPYCNNHMQVLGMLPRRERKPKKEKETKDKDTSNKDNVTSLDANKMTFGDRLKSKKLTLPKPAVASPLMGKILTPVDDPDDPYAFHDAAPEVSPVPNSMTPGGPAGMLPGGLADMAKSPYPQSLPSPSQSRPAGEGLGTGCMPKAKLYPELAEKLEKPRPSQEAKTSKSRARSSRTMNKLQTKIAQNKIKDKLRKSQESNQAELSPSQVASPERVGLGASALLNSGIVGADFGAVPGTDMNPVNLNTTQLHPLALPGLGLPPIDRIRTQGLGPAGLSGSTPDSLEIERLKQRVVTPHHHPFHPLPPPYPGSSVKREQHFSPAEGAETSRTAGQNPVVEMPVTTSLPSHTPLHPYLSFSQASSLSVPVVSPAQSQPHHHHLQHQSQSSSLQSHSLPRQKSQASQGSTHSVIPANNIDLPFTPQLSSVLSQTVANRTSHHSSANSAFPQTSAILTSKPPPPSPLVSSRSVDVRTSLDLPPPPPYVPRTRTCSVPTSVTNSSSVLMTHIQRPKGILTEKEAHCRLKNDDAVKLYGMYARQKIHNHVFVNSTMSLCASDEESSEDEIMEEPLPFQRDWKVISDDEEDNELEEDGELPSDLRMVKLGVMRARYRRHCTQTKHANRINTKDMSMTRKFTLALIKLAKSSASTAAHCLSAITTKPLQWPQERKNKRKEIWRKVCQYKDGADKRCTVMCLPYTNHCRKHIMYNVDQQLFQFCTAKNSDNTQCCMPVIDIRHDFPLCYPHALQAEKQKKEEAAEVKKRPRKKTKPPALTRPPRKGKKKKGKNMRYQKPIPPDKPVSNTSLPEAEQMEVAPSTSALPEPQPEVPTPVAAATPTAANQPSVSAPPAPPVTAPAPAPTPAPAPAPTPVVAAATVALSQEVVKEVAVAPPLTASRVSMITDAKQQLEQALDLEETDFDKQLAELPLEQASRLLEDDAFENFPDDAFNDIFTMADKNGESDLAQENEKLERQLAEVTFGVNKAKDTLEKVLNGSINIADMGEQDTKQLAEMIATHYTVETVHQAEISSSTATPVLDSFSGLTEDQAIGEIALSLQTQQPQLPGPALANYTPGTVAGNTRGMVPQTIGSMASFLPSGAATTMNGMSVPGAVAQNSPAYNQPLAASLAAGYVASSPIQQQLSGVHSAGHVYSEGQHAQNYHVVQTAAQTHAQLAGYSGLQALPSAAVLLSGGAGGSVTANQQQQLSNQQQQLLARSLSRQQQQQQSHLTGGASLSTQVLSRQMDMAGSALHPQPGPSAETLHPGPGPSTVPQQLAVVHTQGLGSGVGSQLPGAPPPRPSTSQLSSQLQAQPVLAAQLASSPHSTWIHTAAALQQQQQAPGYHTVNGFPSTAQLPYTNAAITTAHTLSSNSAVRQQSKMKSLPVQMAEASSPALRSAGTPPTTVASYPMITKQDLHSAAASLVNTIGLNTAPSPPVTGLKQDPRIAALAQQRSRAVGRSGSPGLQGFVRGHSPSPIPSPQAVTQNLNLPPFSPALSAYQGNSTGS